MAKPEYSDVVGAVNDLIYEHRKANDGYEYPATLGNLTAILGMLISGQYSRHEAFAALQQTARDVKNRK